MRALPIVIALLASVSLSGCVAKTLVDIATLPVRAGAKAVDLATTSQSEADEKRGRELRKREERLGKLERDYARQMRKCESGEEEACTKAREIYAEIEDLLPTIPTEPDR